MTIPCQASKEEGVTTIGSSPSTTAIGTPLEVPTNYFNNSNGNVGHFEIVEDIV